MRRSPWLAAGCVFCGLLTILVAFYVFGMGWAFANATASGTGAAGMFVGLWMLLAARGVARRRSPTLVGLSLAWLWLIGRVVVDFPATGTTAVIFGSIMGVVGIAVGLAWLALAALAVPVVWARTVGVAAAPLFAQRKPDGLALQKRARSSRRTTLGVVFRLGLLAGVTLLVPQLAWWERGEKIAALARHYAPSAESRPDATSAPRRPADFGACSVVFLGYELTRHGAESLDKTDARRPEIYQRTLQDALADLQAIQATGASYVRVGASGDHLLKSNPDQETLDDRYMEAVRRTGIPLVLVDCQHPQAVGKRLSWTEFCRFQRRRIEYYQRRYHPDVYFVACEPLTYHQMTLTPRTRFSAGAWARQLAEMCRTVKSIDPRSRTGICLLVAEEKKPEWEVWTRMRELPELDILGVEIYMPECFAQTEQRLAQFGHPRRFGKRFWIAETYNGWALCNRRRWDQDAAWLRVAADFAGTVDAEAVLVWTFGSFIPRGSFYDYYRGRLRERWQHAGRLSEVGQAVRRLQTSLPADAPVRPAR